jgi:hypothetical protein
MFYKKRLTSGLSLVIIPSKLNISEIFNINVNYMAAALRMAGRPVQRHRCRPNAGW